MTADIWRKGVIGGLGAGLVFVMMEMALVPTVGGGELWGPPRMMGAIVLGTDALPPPATFDAAIVMVGLIVHFALSAVLGVIFAAAAAKLRLSGAMAIAAGAVFGLIVYAVNFYGLTALFPWFAMARNAITIASHVVFGAVLGWYCSRGTAAQLSA
jgi:uncharacterized membrane protein YagU involved in acid resistance